MKIFLLREIETDGNGWFEWCEAKELRYSQYAACQGFVVRANSEEDARLIAKECEVKERSAPASDRWLDASVTSCIEIKLDGVQEVIMGDWPTG